MARASLEQLAALETYGNKLGLAFQIVDDVLDLRGDEAPMGKRLGKDAARGKLTFPAVLGIEESLRRAQVLVAEACAALELVPGAGWCLQALASYVIHRSR